MSNYKGIHRSSILVVIVLIAVFLPGCGLFGDSHNSAGNGDKQTVEEQPIVRFEGEPSKAVSSVFTTSRELSLTFNGMGDDKTMKQLLDELDRYQIKATFFLPGMRVAEEPEIAKEILSRGHEIANNTLNRLDMTKLSYEEIYKEIQVSNEIIEKETGIRPQYIRTRSGDYNENVRLAAAQAGMQAVVSYSLNLQAWHLDSKEDVGEYVRSYVTRGGIIALNTEGNSQAVDTIPLIAEAAADVKYKLVPLSKLLEKGMERKPLESIAGYDTAKINLNYKDAKYKAVDRGNPNSKEIALTFDDWGYDFTVTKILDLLDVYKVKSTFFLRANGVEKNPNLAKAIAEAGHDVANHTYSHPVITKLTPEQLQEEVVKAHQIITEAIQQKPTMLFRPPTGEIDDTAAKVVAATGYTTIALYNVTALDWDVSHSADDIIRIITEKTENGSVILLHMLDHIHTLEALPTVIKELRAKGYTFVTMSDMLDMKE
ncbi:polysaccharide deacetylase family protein [Paenibacillus mendelii]|uniref:Polysaccharide deacetylase family protein n=1 Tax=Paenibacillus mendelii TaxID=206163 RepID=A0ABV6JKM6_9BACL|nr:polysaccharide deacetylase family protein [Paenibacillus mendelii]MCQ6563034.1 polysaccharide deacetylase family protein [Paenibacillus mendelii]